MDVGIDDGKIDHADASLSLNLIGRSSQPLPIRLSAGTSTGSSFNPPRTRSSVAASMALTRSRFLSVSVDARARNDDHAVAVADHHVARGDRHAAADDRQADRAGPAPLRRIRRDAHGEDRQADRFEVVEVAHQAVGDEARGAAIARDIRSADLRSRPRRHSRSVATTSTSPGLHSASAAMNARLSSGPQSQVSATPTKRPPTSRLIRQSSAPVPFIASTMKLVGRAKALDDIGRRAFDGRGENERRRFLDHDGLQVSIVCAAERSRRLRWRADRMHVRRARATAGVRPTRRLRRFRI